MKLESRVSMRAPPGIAKFDSATAMALALARFLDGKDFPALGQSKFLQALASLGDFVPRRPRERIFAVLGAHEAVAPEAIEQVRADGVAEWLVSLYPQRRYPAVMIGSSSGALVHIGAAFGIPWLPQTFLTLVRQTGISPDDPVRAMENGRETARRFLEVNPEVQLHHLHDPSQDRLMLSLITYFRAKYRKLPQAYHDFILRTLEPGGTIVITECRRRWPVTRLGESYVYQFGAVGGPTLDEYFSGGQRVEAYLARYNVPVRRWHPPAPDDESPEAEWGFEPTLAADIARFALEHGYRVKRIVFDDPEHLSPVVADFYRDWYTQRGIRPERLVIESFVVLEPYWTLRTGCVPFWMTFNMEPSLDWINRYLDRVEPYDYIYLTLFAHGVNSVGLPPIEAWQALLRRAQRSGRFLGLRPSTYPAHFAAFARYSGAMRRIPERHPLPEFLPMDRFGVFVGESVTKESAAHAIRRFK